MSSIPCSYPQAGPLVSNQKQQRAEAAIDPISIFYRLSDGHLLRFPGMADFSMDAVVAPPISYSSKARLLAGRMLEHNSRALPLRAIYLLDIEERDVLERHFTTLSDLARQGIVFRLCYPRDYSRLPAVRTAIHQHAANQ